MASGGGKSILIEWYPKNMSVFCSKKEDKKKCTFTFTVRDFKAKGMLKKVPVEGEFTTSKMESEARAFTFSIKPEASKHYIKCNVKNLPEDIQEKPSHELKDGYIIVTVKKVAGSKLNWESFKDDIQELKAADL